jgi:hypothetical protein
MIEGLISANTPHSLLHALELIREIEDKQFIGNKKDFEKIMGFKYCKKCRAMRRFNYCGACCVCGDD